MIPTIRALFAEPVPLGRDRPRRMAGLGLSVLAHGLLVAGCLVAWPLSPGGDEPAPGGGGGGPGVVMIDLAGVALPGPAPGHPWGRDDPDGSEPLPREAEVADPPAPVLISESTARPARPQLVQVRPKAAKSQPKGREDGAGTSGQDVSTDTGSPADTAGSIAGGGPAGSGTQASQGAGQGSDQGAGQSGHGGLESGRGSGALALAEVDQKPRLVRHVEPEYPEHARKRAVCGKVLARFLVDESGEVHDPAVTSSDPSGIFEQSVLDAVRRWRFEPARHRGKPVAVVVTVPVRFDIQAR